MMFPSFLGIGAQKCATTWLSHNLSHHPEIWMPPRKELHYFDYRIKDPRTPFVLFRARLHDNYHGLWRMQARNRTCSYLTGKHPLRNAPWDLKYLVPRGSDEWYAALFDPARGRVSGEITPNYAVLNDETIAHICKIMPDVKIIFMMRNPIERAFSHVGMYLSKRAVRDAAEGKYLEHFENRRSKLKTDYLLTLERWRRFYPAERIFVGFLEDVNFYPGRFLARLYRFLEVSPEVATRPSRDRPNRRAGRGATIPASQAAYLARTYHGDIERLDARFGGYASFWRFCAERLLEQPLTEDVSYPLWESPMWVEWTRSQRPRSGSDDGELQSGKLSILLS